MSSNVPMTETREIVIYMDPDTLRRMASDMEKHMERTLVGDPVWYERHFGDNGLSVKFSTNQRWFNEHRMNAR